MRALSLSKGAALAVPFEDSRNCQLYDKTFPFMDSHFNTRLTIFYQRSPQLKQDRSANVMALKTTVLPWIPDGQLPSDRHLGRSPCWPLWVSRLEALWEFQGDHLPVPGFVWRPSFEGAKLKYAVRPVPASLPLLLPLLYCVCCTVGSTAQFDGETGCSWDVGQPLIQEMDGSIETPWCFFGSLVDIIFFLL